MPEEKPKKIRRINRGDLKILRCFLKQGNRFQRAYQRWQEAQCDVLGIFRSWVRSWTDGHVINRDDPQKPEPLKPLPVDIREKARNMENEILAAQDRFEEYLGKLADKHGCASTDIVVQVTDQTGKSNGKMLGAIEGDLAVEELDALEHGEEYLDGLE